MLATELILSTEFIEPRLYSLATVVLSCIRRINRALKPCQRCLSENGLDFTEFETTMS
jgi:hypothetical protein